MKRTKDDELKPTADEVRMMREMIDALRALYSNVSVACKIVGIPRDKHTYFLETFSTYQEEYAKIQEELIDFAESKLREKVKEGSPSSIAFLARTKGLPN